MTKLTFEFRTSAEENAQIRESVAKVDKKINKLEEQIKSLREQQSNMLEQILIDCPSCSKPFPIMESEYLQTHWYTPPRGCSEGDYWNTGEGNCICPHCESRLRLYKVPEIEKLKYQFKSVRDVYER